MTKISNQYSLTNVLTADAVNGRVGIGTASTGFNAAGLPLVVGSGSGNTGLTIFSGSSGYGSIHFADAESTGNPSYVGVINYDHSANTMQFNTNNAERMKITSGGSIGVNNSNPVNTAWGNETNTKQLSIDASAYSVINLQGGSRKYSMGVGNDIFYMCYDNTASRHNIIVTGNGNVGVGTTAPENNVNQTSLTINGTSVSRLDMHVSGVKRSGLVTATDATYLETSTSIPLVFITNNTEKMRILSNGNVGIGVTNPSYKLEVNGEFLSKGAATAAYSYEDRYNTSIVYTMFAYAGYTNFYNGGNKAQINMSNGAYTALSDINKKKDFEQSNIGLNEVMQLKPTLYRMNTDVESSPKELGFIAQEVKEFIPQAYVENESQDDVFIGLNQMPLIAALTKAIQEQQTQINELKALLNAH